MQQTLSNNLNQRLQATIEDLQEKHLTGRNEVDAPDRAPTGPAYQAIRAQQQLLRQQHQKHTQQPPALVQPKQDEERDSDDDEFDDLLDDPDLEELRDRRLEELKQAHEIQQYQLARGHGQYRTIRQDEFLAECNSSDDNDAAVVVHFAHEEFLRCKIMDHHLKELAEQYLECKFVRIVADKAPFFVQNLKVRTLPTLLVFRHGKVIERLTGFEGLTPSNDETWHTSGTTTTNSADEWETWRLAKWLSDRTGALHFKGAQGKEREALFELQQSHRQRPQNGGTVYRGGGIHSFSPDGE